MKKKLTAVALIVCMLAIMLVGASLAYFTDEDEATNTFTVGNVEIDLLEPAWDEETGTGEKDAPSVYPGEKLAKDPYVKNTGKNPCFVRIKVEGLDCLKTFGASDIALEGLDTTNWTKVGDYYYFNSVVTYVGDDYNTTLPTETTKLFTGIRIPTDLENLTAEQQEAVAEGLNVVVTAEAVQAQGARGPWAEVKAMTVAEIATWFGTCGMDAAE